MMLGLTRLRLNPLKEKLISSPFKEVRLIYIDPFNKRNQHVYESPNRIKMYILLLKSLKKQK